MAKSEAMKKAFELMGKVVTVDTIYERKRDYTNGKRYWVKKKLDKPRAGWVVGKVSLQNGQWHDGYSYGGDYYNPPEYDQPYLAVESVTHAIKVCWWPNRKPAFVPLEAIEIGGTPDCREYEWQDAWKEEAKTWPRDAKGRWC